MRDQSSHARVNSPFVRTEKHVQPIPAVLTQSRVYKEKIGKPVRVPPSRDDGLLDTRVSWQITRHVQTIAYGTAVARRSIGKMQLQRTPESIPARRDSHKMNLSSHSPTALSALIECNQGFAAAHTDVLHTSSLLRALFWNSSS